MKSEKLNLLVDCKSIDKRDYEEKKELISLHISELERLGVSVVNNSTLPTNKARGVDDVFVKIKEKDGCKLFSGDQIVLATEYGELSGQKDIVISGGLGEMATATVTFFISGFFRG